MVSNPYLQAMKRPFIRGITPFRGLTITMVINHLLNGMILQVQLGNSVDIPEIQGQIRTNFQAGGVTLSGEK